MDELLKYNNVLFQEYPDVVNAEQLQKMLNIKRTKAYELLRSGAIKSIKIGRDYKISKLNIIKYLFGENNEE